MDTRNIVVVGARGVGKSALVHRLLKNEFLEDYKETRMSAMREAIINESSVYVTDMPGYEDAPAALKHLPDNTSAALIVFSVTDKKSFDDLSALIEKIREKMKGPVILIGNKTDLIASREVTRADAANFAKKMNLTYIEVSAKNAVDKIFQVALEQINNPTKVIEILASGELEALNKNSSDGDLQELIREVDVALKDVGKSRVEMRNTALDACRKTNDINVAIKALEVCAENAQEDHVKRSGARWVFGQWGPLFKSVSKTKQTIDEIVLKYKAPQKM